MGDTPGHSREKYSLKRRFPWAYESESDDEQREDLPSPLRGDDSQEASCWRTKRIVLNEKPENNWNELLVLRKYGRHMQHVTIYCKLCIRSSKTRLLPETIIPLSQSLSYLKASRLKEFTLSGYFKTSDIQFYRNVKNFIDSQNTLEELTINDLNIKPLAEGAQLISSLVRNNRSSLRHLVIYDLIDPSEASPGTPISHVMTPLTTLEKLTNLTINYNYLNRDLLGELLNKCPSLTNLTLRLNVTDVADIQPIADDLNCPWRIANHEQLSVHMTFDMFISLDDTVDCNSITRLIQKQTPLSTLKLGAVMETVDIAMLFLYLEKNFYHRLENLELLCDVKQEDELIRTEFVSMMRECSKLRSVTMIQAHLQTEVIDDICNFFSYFHTELRKFHIVFAEGVELDVLNYQRITDIETTGVDFRFTVGLENQMQMENYTNQHNWFTFLLYHYLVLLPVPDVLPVPDDQ